MEIDLVCIPLLAHLLKSAWHDPCGRSQCVQVPPFPARPLAGGAGAVERRPGHSERRSGLVAGSPLFSAGCAGPPSTFYVSRSAVHRYARPMRNAAAAALVFIGGFIIMVLEIIGARFLAKDFGSSFHVWVSQIGVVLIALALGYYLGGALADKWQRLSFLVALLVPAGIVQFLIPNCAAGLIDAIIFRHPADQPIPLLWQKLDPVMGSAVIFLAPCVALATLSPYMIRLSTSSLAQVGRSSGFIIAAS